MPRIDTIWVFLAVDKETGDEGVISMFKDGQHLPLVCADRRRIDSFRPLAQQIAKETGTTVRLVKFEVRSVMEVYEPSI